MTSRSEAGSELSGLLDELAGQFRAHGYNLKFLIRVLTATRAYNLSSVANQAESTTPMFASMPVRGLSPGQLFDSLTQATGAEPGDARARFLELFASRDDRPVEAETTIIQALTMMNGSLHRRRHQPETEPGAWGDRQGPVPGHAGSDRNPLPGDPDPPPEARRAGASGSIRRRQKDRR